MMTLCISYFVPAYLTHHIFTRAWSTVPMHSVNKNFEMVWEHLGRVNRHITLIQKWIRETWMDWHWCWHLSGCSRCSCREVPARDYLAGLNSRFPMSPCYSAWTDFQQLRQTHQGAADWSYRVARLVASSVSQQTQCTFTLVIAILGLISQSNSEMPGSHFWY